MSNRRILEVKVIRPEGSDPETFQFDIDGDKKLNLLVFRRPLSLTESQISDLTKVTKLTTGNECGALVLDKDDIFEVYEVPVLSRYEREQVI